MNPCDHCGLPVGAAPVASADGTRAYCCYGCRMVDEVLGSDAVHSPALAESEAQRRLRWRVAAGALAAMFAMALSLAISTGYGFAALRTLDSGIGPAHIALLAAVAPILALLGGPLVNAAWSDLRRGQLSLHTLFVLGVGSAVAVSAVSYVRGGGPVYLETAAMLLVLYTLGRYFEARTKHEATRVLRGLLDVPRSPFLRVRDDGTVEEVQAAAFVVGDSLRLRAGEVAPVDGVVTAGQAYVSEQTWTGEAQPVVRSLGDGLYAGAAPLDGALTLRVTAIAEDRRLARVERLLRDALAKPVAVVAQTDRAMRWLIPAVLVFALATFGGWFVAVGFEAALYASLSVVLIACPCALGLAVPLALMVALREAARRGVLLGSGQALLDLADVRAVAFDKTGTLSAMDAAAVEVLVAQPVFAGGNGEPAPLDAGAVLSLAAGLEAAVRHPLAAPVLAHAETQGVTLSSVADARTVPGVGVVGTVETLFGPQPVGIGNESLLEMLGVTAHPLDDDAARVEAEGGAPLVVVEGDAVVGLVVLREEAQPHAAEAVVALQGQGLPVAVLTGDSGAAARRFTAGLSEQDGADVVTHARLTPESKLDALRSLQREHGAVLMVGDGVNDAAALAAANVGLAVGSGAEVSIDAADGVLYNPDLRNVPALLALSRRTRRTIRQNLGWTFGYNAVGLGLAVAGLLHPLVAVAIMAVSSVFVVANALRLRSPESIA
ncbi:MAG: heavy metal translocating P-type ATPase [Bacteroidota bacterium]